jgi:hypothetical protein
VTTTEHVPVHGALDVSITSAKMEAQFRPQLAPPQQNGGAASLGARASPRLSFQRSFTGVCALLISISLPRISRSIKQ